MPSVAFATQTPASSLARGSTCPK